MSSPAPRTLADQLRSWTDEQLTRLLLARPDLAVPAPQDSSQLASRAGTRASVARAVDSLTVLELTVLEAAVLGTAGVESGAPVVPGVSLSGLQRLVNAAPEPVAVAVDRLVELALLWGDAEDLRPLHVLSDLVGRTQRSGPTAAQLLAGYRPSRVGTLASDLGLEPTGDRGTDIAGIAAHLADCSNVDVLLAEVGAQARRILDHLDREGSEGKVESTERRVGRRDAQSPVDQLLSRGLLLARDPRHVAVPREVSVCLRGGRTTRHRVDDVPALATAPREQTLVDRTAAGAAFELVRHVQLLLEHWGVEPPTALRGGGLGVRDLRAATVLLHVDRATAALLIELAAAAGLVAVGESGTDPVWLPTSDFDTWAASTVAARWARLAQAWVETPRLIGLVGGRSPDQRPVNPLVPDLEHPWLPETRSMCLQQLAGLPEGEVLASGTGPPSLVDRLAWLRPRRPALRARAVGWALEEAAVVGVLALGGLSQQGRALVGGDEPLAAAAATLEPLLPQPVDHVLLQADLTAVAPGPLEHELASHLATLADVESRGGATVYRFTERSIRRAFDGGWSAAEITALLTTSSRTPVPQPLLYLVQDVSRRFGTVRVGAAESFLRSDDEAALDELVHDPRSAALRLRRIAPTVVISDVPVDVLLPKLRELGGAPVVEAPDGTVHVARRDSARARTPRTRAPEARAAARTAARVAATVTAIRAGDKAAANRPTSGHEGPERPSPMATMALLREAADAAGTVWIGYVDDAGVTVERIVDPLRVEGGRLTAFDHRAATVRSFAIHRVTAVGPVSREPDAAGATP